MEEELVKLNDAINKIMQCNLDEETKAFVLSQMKKRLFDLKNEIALVKKNVETYHGSK